MRQLFTEEEANLALYLSMIPEEARVIARCIGMSVESVSQLLEGMNRKGLVIGIEKEGRLPQYAAMQFVVGFL